MSTLKVNTIQSFTGAAPVVLNDEVGISGSLQISGTLLPDMDDQFDLGSSAKQWKDLYVDGTAYVDALDAGGSGTGSFGFVSASGTITAGTFLATTGFQNPGISVTATDAGASITAGTGVAVVNADSDANHIVKLPFAVVGNIIHIIEDGTTGYELRSSHPGSTAINGGKATNAESAIAGAITYVKCVCVSGGVSGSWIASQLDADGDESKVEAAA
mgnify:CR=1 FL=1